MRKAIRIEPHAQEWKSRFWELFWFLKEQAKWYNPFKKESHRLSVSAALIPYPTDGGH
jgi:hypothetical protein